MKMLNVNGEIVVNMTVTDSSAGWNKLYELCSILNKEKGVYAFPNRAEGHGISSRTPIYQLLKMELD